MTALVDARALWWRDPEVCDCYEEYTEWCTHETVGGWVSPMHHGTVDGVTFITDRYVLLPVANLGGLPVGYDKVLGLEPLRPQAMDGLALWMSGRVVPDPSDRVFSRWLIDPLEKAGFRVRPVEGVKDAHAVCGPDLEVFGLAIPLRRADAFEDPTTTRVAV